MRPYYVGGDSKKSNLLGDNFAITTIACQAIFAFSHKAEPVMLMPMTYIGQYK